MGSGVFIVDEVERINGGFESQAVPQCRIVLIVFSLG